MTPTRSAVSNTGPLISALQSDCMPILFQYSDQIHIPANEIQECQKHGAGQEIAKLVESGFLVVHQDFNGSENDAAKAIAEAIAEHHFTRDKNWSHRSS